MKDLLKQNDYALRHFIHAEFLLQQHRTPVDARMARRKVSAWLVRDVGNLLFSGAIPVANGDFQLAWEEFDGQWVSMLKLLSRPR